MPIIDDVRKLQVEVKELSDQLENEKRLSGLVHEQINGERGLSAVINQQTTEIKGLRKAAYWVAGLIISGSIGFAFSVLALIG